MLHRWLSAPHGSLGIRLSENEHITYGIIGTLLIVTEGINWTGCWHCTCKQGFPGQSGGYSHPTPKPWPRTLPDLGQVVTSSLSWWTPCPFMLSRHLQHEKAEAWRADQKPPAWPRQSDQLILLDPALQLRAACLWGCPQLSRYFSCLLFKIWPPGRICGWQGKIQNTGLYLPLILSLGFFPTNT